MNDAQGKAHLKAVALRHFALLAFAAMAWTGDAAAEKFLVLSLVGDHVTLVKQENTAGSHLDRNRYEAVPLNDTFMDDAALLAVKGAVLKIRPNATVELLRARDPKAYLGRNEWLVQDSAIIRELMANLSQEAATSPDVRLVLVSPVMDSPRFKGEETIKGSGVGYFQGNGRAAGLGLYTGKGISGLGIFANFQLAVIDLRSGNIEAHERVSVGVENAASLVPNAIAGSTPSGKDNLLAMQSLLSEEIARQVPVLFKSLKP